jgi:hypothetical protein
MHMHITQPPPPSAISAAMASTTINPGCIPGVCAGGCAANVGAPMGAPWCDTAIGPWPTGASGMAGGP